MKRARFFAVLLVLLSALIFGAVQTQEALAVAPCASYCDDVSKCWKKCVCETPEWGDKILFCARCPYFPNNPCV